MSDFYDIDGQPITLWEWVEAFEKSEGRRIGHDKIGDTTVSTVWLGLDHNIGKEGPPLIFETMVFGGPLDQTTVRYSTKEEAKIGHMEMVEKVKS